MLTGGAEHHAASDYDATVRSCVQRPRSMTMLLPLCVISPMSEWEVARGGLNAALRGGLDNPSAVMRPHRVPRRPQGLRAGFGLDKALPLAGELEDDEMVCTLSLRT